jgi:hypothetical protein
MGRIRVFRLGRVGLGFFLSSGEIFGPCPTCRMVGWFFGRVGSGLLLLTQKVHLAPNTQQAEKLASHAQRVEMTCQSNFPEN